nr:enoyl-CoA hydratase-related protein [uncultured Bacillus sp.]
MTIQNNSIKEKTFSSLLCEIDERIAIVSINRPPVNPLNTQVFEELIQLMDELEANEDVNVILITGNGDKAFVAGADLNEMMHLDTVGMLNMSQVSRRAFSKIENLSKPVIAVINGLALGGGFELALACDLRIASEKAKFAFPEIGLGIIPGGGGTQRIQKIAGQGIAKELLYFGEMIDAAQALKLHIINKVTPHSDLISTAKEWARKLTQKPAVALRMMKTAVQAGSNVDLDSGLMLEAACFVSAFSTEDRKEGMAAFVEKRKPNFTGR